MDAATLTHSILAIGGRARRDDDELAFGPGGDPVFPTPFRIALAASAALGAAGLALADVWRLRTGRGQAVRVDPRAAEIASLLTETDSPFGRVAHFKPVLELSGTPGFYASPPEPFGTSPAAWR